MSDPCQFRIGYLAGVEQGRREAGDYEARKSWVPSVDVLHMLLAGGGDT